MVISPSDYVQVSLNVSTFGEFYRIVESTTLVKATGNEVALEVFSKVFASDCFFTFTICVGL